MTIEVSSTALHHILSHARRAAPEECCGLLLGEGGQITEAAAAANVHEAPTSRFSIDPQMLIDAFRMERAGGPKVLGYYHSHPLGPVYPSAIDRDEAGHDGRVWAIATLDEVRFWRDDATGFVPLSLRLLDR